MNLSGPHPNVPLLRVPKNREILIALFGTYYFKPVETDVNVVDS